MTIAIGLLASDGLVLAADGQITAGDDKLSMGKWHCQSLANPGGAGPGSSVVLCAGTHPVYMREAMSTVQGVFRDELDDVDDPLRHKLSDALTDFFVDRINPFAEHGENRPQVELIVGYDRPGARQVLHSQLGLFGNDVYGAIGIGAPHALRLLQNLWRFPGPDIFGTAMLAAYVMHYAKAASIYCGKHTDMFLVRGGRIQILRRQQTQRLEQLMEEYQRHLEPAAFRNAIEQPLTTEQSHAGFIAAAQIRQAIADLRATWDATYPTSPTSSSSDQT